MPKSIDLIQFGKEKVAIHWPLGQILNCDFNLQAVCKLIETRLPFSSAEAFLFWDGALGQPDTDMLQELLKQPIDLWHAGLKLGMGGLPGAIDFVQPTWMLNRDPDPDIESTSWRLSLRACLIRVEVLRQMGGPRPDFEMIEAAVLEMGHRFISRGVLMRHLPSLLPAGQPKGNERSQEILDTLPTSFPNAFIGNPRVTDPRQNHSRMTYQSALIPFEDELRFIYYRFGKKWASWALMRAVSSGYVSPVKAFAAYHVILRAEPEESKRSIFRRVNPEILCITQQDEKKPLIEKPPPAVSVLIPTLDRYPYLRPLLDQLRKQTVKPLEIIVIDQTPIERRELQLPNELKDLPLKMIYRDQPGQCSSRNAGLQVAQGNYVLFLDDDNEIQPDLIEKHLKSLNFFKNEVSSGVAEEDGAGPLPENFTYLRTSDVFPTNNTMIRQEVLKKSGLFDLAYDRKQRADADLGMRIYLTGATMVLNPSISVLHHHAPQGGLRTHKARVVTYASSRKSLFLRHLPSDSEIYLGMRYFTARQIRESLWLRVFGTFSFDGARIKRVLKFTVGLALLPNTIWKVWQMSVYAKRMLQTFPSIPALPNSREAVIEK